MSSSPPKHQYPAWLAPALAKALRVNLDSENGRERINRDDNCYITVELDDETVEQFERIYQKIQARYAQRSQETKASTSQDLPETQTQEKEEASSTQTNKNENDNSLKEVKN
jgi:hypothetical protein